MSVRVSKLRTAKYQHAKRRQPILDFWSVIAGSAPPVNNIGYGGTAALEGELTCLADAVACFEGVNRPLNEDDRGDRLLSYVLLPKVHYGYIPHMVCSVEKLDVPNDMVVVAHVMPDFPHAPEAGSSMGVLTHWEFVEHDGSEERLPVSHQDRYRLRRW